MEEEGFLPVTSVSVSRAGEATVIRVTDLHRPDSMQGTASLFDHDEEEQQSDRDQSVTTEPGVEDLALEDSWEENNEQSSLEVEDYGSGSREANGSSEEQQKEVLEQMGLAETNVRTDLQPRVSVEEEKSKNETDLKPRSGDQSEDVGEDGKKTWYFWK